MRYVLTTFICLWCYLPDAISAEIAIIANKDSDYSLSKKDIKMIFLGQKKLFADGAKTNPIDQDITSKHFELFHRHVTKKTVLQVRAYWGRLVFTGRGTPPINVKGEDKIIDLVKEEKNSIAYVSSTSERLDEVRVIAKFPWYGAFIVAW